MIDELIEHHERMYAVTVQAEPLLRAETPDAFQLGLARVRQARLITAHQLFVHREVFDPVISGGTMAEIGQARALKAECCALAEAFRHHARRWQIDDINALWPEYQPAAVSLMHRIRAQITDITMLAIPLRELDAELRRPRVKGAVQWQAA